MSELINELMNVHCCFRMAYKRSCTLSA